MTLTLEKKFVKISLIMMQIIQLYRMRLRNLLSGKVLWIIYFQLYVHFSWEAGVTTLEESIFSTFIFSFAWFKQVIFKIIKYGLDIEPWIFILGGLILNSYFMSWPKEYLLFSVNLPVAISGGHISFSMGIASFITDISSPEQRTFRWNISV